MSDDQLQPSRFDEKSMQSFGPQIPWKWIVPAIACIVVVIVAVNQRGARDLEDLRARILQVHEGQIVPLAERILDFRSGLEVKIQESAEGITEDYADPRFRFSGIHNAQVLYLRISAEDAESPESIREAALSSLPDSIGSCLGIAPISMRGLYASDAPLQPVWLEEVREAENRQRLEALDYSIGQHVERELPLLMTMTQSQLFMLVVERGETRRSHPVDVFLWDLSRDTLLVKARVTSRGRLLSVHVRTDESPGIRRERRPNNTSGAIDCSIAQQVRAVTGEGVIEIENDAPDRVAIDDARAAAAAGDAGVGEDGGESASAEEGEGGTDAPAQPSEEAAQPSEEAAQPSEEAAQP